MSNTLSSNEINVLKSVGAKVEWNPDNKQCVVTAPGGTTATLSIADTKKACEILSKITATANTIKASGNRFATSALPKLTEGAINYAVMVMKLAKTLGQPCVADLIGAKLKGSIEALIPKKG